jgi:hypothetical protein
MMIIPAARSCSWPSDAADRWRRKVRSVVVGGLFSDRQTVVPADFIVLCQLGDGISHTTVDCHDRRG